MRGLRWTDRIAEASREFPVPPSAFSDSSIVQPSENHCLDEGVLESRKRGKFLCAQGVNMQFSLPGEIGRLDLDVFSGLLHRVALSGHGQPSGRFNGQEYCSTRVSGLKSSGAVRGTALRAHPCVSISLLTGRITRSPGRSVRPLGSDAAALRPSKNATSGPKTSKMPGTLTFSSMTHGTQPNRRSISPRVSGNDLMLSMPNSRAGSHSCQERTAT